jgi:hypothetical protein
MEAVALLDSQTERRDKTANRSRVSCHGRYSRNRYHYSRWNGSKYPARCSQKKLKVRPIRLVLTGDFFLDAISVDLDIGVEFGIEFNASAGVVALGIDFSFRNYSGKPSTSN